MNSAPKAKNCGRCKGTGYARFNHLNGDTHCYLCDGTGVQLTYTKAQRERMEADQQWVSDAHYKLVGGFGSFENQIRRTCRELTGSRRSDLRRRMVFWVDLEDGALGEMVESVGKDRRAAEAAAVKAFQDERERKTGSRLAVKEAS